MNGRFANESGVIMHFTETHLYVAKLVKMLLLAGLMLTLGSCAQAPRAISSEEAIINTLRIGMTDQEVSAVVADLKAHESHFLGSGFYAREQNETVGQPCVQYKGLCGSNPDMYLFDLFDGEPFPRDVLKEVGNGTPHRIIEYAYNRFIYLYFDANTQRLRGWVKKPLNHPERFLQERIATRLGIANAYVKRFTREQVYALIGPPNEVFARLKSLPRELREDHFWYNGHVPDLQESGPLELYEYPIGSGVKRRVILAYHSRNGRLTAFGYNHAWEEADRYTRAHQDQPHETLVH
jgi:hypothetical protein